MLEQRDTPHIDRVNTDEPDFTTPSLPAPDLARLLEEQLSKKVGSEKVVAAVSGGVDSAVSTAVAVKALGDRVVPVVVDTGFMRRGEASQVSQLMGEWLKTSVTVVDAHREFASALEGSEDAESKRKAFRESFYSILGEVVSRVEAKYLLQGTIAPDWIETTGGIKTQHNVLAQLGIKTEEKYGFKLLEPLAYLYKDQVRKLGEFLGLPDGFVRRQPFPGPGLLVRVVGKLSVARLELLKDITPVVEEYLQEYSPSQWFAAIFSAAYPSQQEFISGYTNWVFSENVTGVRGDSRVYGRMLGLGPLSTLSAKNFDLSSADAYSQRRTLLGEFVRLPGMVRLCLRLAARRDGSSGYSVVIRAVKTSDFMTADILEPPFPALKFLSEKVLAASESISDVFYDLTPKPPATIEFE